MQRIASDIKTGQFHKVYLLYGKQDYLRRQYRDNLVKALTGGETTMNYTYYEGKNASVNEVIDQAETLPFFADKRVIVVENTGWFKTSEDTFADYLERVCDTTVMVCVESEINKRTRTYKAADKAGLCVEFDNPSEDELRRWIWKKVAQEDKKISDRALQVFIEMTGPDMDNMQKELEKLLCFCLEKDVIEVGDVEAICTRQIADQVFNMINAMAEKKQRQAMDLYYDLLALKVPPARILALIVRQFNLLYQVKVMKGKGYDDKTIASHTGLGPWIVRKYVNQASRFQKEYLLQALEDCAKTDYAFKTGKITDVLGVELLLVQFSS